MVEPGMVMSTGKMWRAGSMFVKRMRAAVPLVMATMPPRWCFTGTAAAVSQYPHSLPIDTKRQFGFTFGFFDIGIGGTVNHGADRLESFFQMGRVGNIKFGQIVTLGSDISPGQYLHHICAQHPFCAKDCDRSIHGASFL